MPEPTLDELERVFPMAVAAMPQDDFDSHELILQLAHDHHCRYIAALAAYPGRNDPFRVVHGQIAKRLRKHTELVAWTGETVSEDIFRHPNACATWHRVG